CAPAERRHEPLRELAPVVPGPLRLQLVHAPRSALPGGVDEPVEQVGVGGAHDDETSSAADSSRPVKKCSDSAGLRVGYTPRMRMLLSPNRATSSSSPPSAST